MLAKISSTISFLGGLVKQLTTGTIMSDKSIEITPALIGERILNGSSSALISATRPLKHSKPKPNNTMCVTVRPIPTAKLAQQAADVVFLENNPKR